MEMGMDSGGCWHLPRFPAVRGTQEGSVIEMVTPLVPDSIVERVSEEGTTSFIAASIRPTVLILYKYRVA